MGNSGEQRFAAQLETWTSAEDAVLAEAAEWAIMRINGKGLTSDHEILGD
jgi:hypothetical protein